MFASANISAMRKGARQPSAPDSAEEKLRARLRRWLLYFESESETLKRYELAEHMGISAPHMSNLLNGKAKVGIDTFVLMARFGKSLEHMALFEPPGSVAPTATSEDTSSQDARPTVRKRARGQKSSP